MDAAVAGEELGRDLLDAAAAVCDPWEFRTFLCGCSPPDGLDADEREAYRRAANRTLAIALHGRWNGTRSIDHRVPEMHIVMRASDRTVGVEVAPLFVYGRYRKLARGVSQSIFHCRACKARGCPACGGTGRVWERSVEEAVVPPLVAAAAAAAGSFHGSGREDVDVRMLGDGRPFVAQLERPHRRTLDLDAVTATIREANAGVVEALRLRIVDRRVLRDVTVTHPPKTYRARIEVEGGADAAEAARVTAALSGAALAQRTPVRVSRRRADKVRHRTLLDCSVRALEDGALEMEVRAEGGTYIKEMISGDEGRTTPSVAGILGRPATCAELDVLAVEHEDPPAAGTGGDATSAG